MANLLKSALGYTGPATENLIEFIKNGLRKNATETIILDSCSERRWTGAELEHHVSSIARFLVEKLGIKRGDICTLYGPPNDHSVIIILAIISTGGVSNFLSDEYRYREILDTTRALGAKFLISDKASLEAMRDTLGDLSSNLHVISCDEPFGGYTNNHGSLGDLLKKCCSMQEPSSKLDDLITRANVNPESDHAVVQFSSGTTGKPKSIPRTHKNLCHLVASVDHEELMNLKPGEVIAGSLPVTHRPGLWALLACVNAGSTFVLWNNLSDVHDAFRVVSKYKVTIFSSSLPFLSMLGNTGLKIKDQYDLSSLQHMITSGAKIVRSELPRTLVSELGLKTLRQCFGMTESGWVFLIEASLADESSYLTVGHVCPGTEVIVLDRNTAKPVGANVKGEVALRGSQVFPGYLTDKPGVYNRADFTEDGFFRTGDEGYFDDRELVFIEGRYKELLIFENNGRMFPNEIEADLNAHPSVEGSCVVKVGESEKLHPYDIAKAFVTLKHGCKVTEKELLDFVTERSYYLKLEGGIEILDKFPRLQNGKVDKQALKNRGRAV